MLISNQNALLIEEELNWLQQCIEQRINHYFDPQNTIYNEPSAPLLPEISPDSATVVQEEIAITQDELDAYRAALDASQLELANSTGEIIPSEAEVSIGVDNASQGNQQLEVGDISAYAAFVQKHQLSLEQRKIFVLVLAPILKPELLDKFFVRNSSLDRTFTEFGGFLTKTFSGFMPDIRTALYLLAGTSVSEQLKYLPLLDKNAQFFNSGILNETSIEPSEPYNHRLLQIREDTLHTILYGDQLNLYQQLNFPAILLTSELEWDDLILADITSEQLRELMAWIENGHKIRNDRILKRHISSGYRSLFFGPSGTGKTLTATLIGKKLGRDVYRVDLSKLISKYIGETEKNLEMVFSAAEEQDWVLFFDEADSLFGKRTSIGSSNDRHSNQEVAYLLQRLETCKSVVILASNLKDNMDEAFARRFQSIVHFPKPSVKQRTLLWRKLFSGQLQVDSQVNFQELAEKYDLTGGAMVNILRYCSLMALEAGSEMITLNNLLAGIKREYVKESRTF